MFRCLAVIDEFSRECLALHVAHSIPAASVIEVLERLREERGLPERVICDNGSEFTSRAFDPSLPTYVRHGARKELE